jgi:hypothetical protein
MGVYFLVPVKTFTKSSIYSVYPTKDENEVEEITYKFHAQPFSQGQPIIQLAFFPNVKVI